MKNVDQMNSQIIDWNIHQEILFRSDRLKEDPDTIWFRLSIHLELPGAGISADE